VYKRGKNIPENVCKIKAVALTHMQNTVLKSSIAQGLHSFVQQMLISELKPAFFNVNTDGVSFPQEIQAALKNSLLHLFLL